jgi:hypothetical protein
MQKRALRIFTLVSLLTVLMVANIYANPYSRIQVTIPFAFTLGDKTLPAGQYTIERNRLVPELFMVRSTDGRATARGFTKPVQRPTTQPHAKLVFHRYGDQYFLAQVWRMDGGEAFLKSPAERAAAKRAAKHLAKTDAEPELISIAAQ